MKSAVRQRSSRWLSRGFSVVLALITACLCVGIGSALAEAKPEADTSTPTIYTDQKVIKIQDQPFYPELEMWRQRWDEGNFYGEITGVSAKETVLKFYSAMSIAGELTREVAAQASTDPGLGWSKEAQEKINDAELLFTTASQAINAYDIPESARDDAQEEAALKLKEALDYIFNNSKSPINIPDERKKGYERIPGSTISLSTNIGEESPDNPFYYFTSDTLESIDNVYRQILKIREPASTPTNNPYRTPRAYSSYTYTPGYLMPPKPYLLLPKNIRGFLEIPIGEQSLFQISASLIVILIYLPIISKLLLTFSNTFRYGKELNNCWTKRLIKHDNPAWRRFILIAPIAPLSAIAQDLIGEKINLTGPLLRKLDFTFDMLTYISLGATIILLFEAIGRSGPIWVAKFRCSDSEIERKRIQNILLPISRFLGALTAVLVLYQMLLRLGMPNTTVLAFSAVPGLAIGLGASKLLGNLFAGISIQSDRPIRVGEFCQVGNEIGFVKRIGLRSIELSTMSANVTIPNNKVDETTIVNYTRQQKNELGQEIQPLQSIKYDLTLPQGLSIGQLNDVTDRCKDYLSKLNNVSYYSASFDENQSGMITLQVLAEVRVDSWDSYITIKQSMLSEIKLIIAVVKNLQRSIGISRDTPLAVVERVPSLIADVIKGDDLLSLSVCRLSGISDYSLDFVFFLESSYTDVGGFFDAMARLNKGILNSFEANGIEIPYPTRMEIQKRVS